MWYAGTLEVSSSLLVVEAVYKEKENLYWTMHVASHAGKLW